MPHRLRLRPHGRRPAQLAGGNDMGRNANGRSSIYQGKDGYWHGRVTVGTKDDGRPDRRHVMARPRPRSLRRSRSWKSFETRAECPRPGSAGLSRSGYGTGSTTSRPRRGSRRTRTPATAWTSRSTSFPASALTAWTSSRRSTARSSTRGCRGSVDFRRERLIMYTARSAMP